ncbi:MAG: DUF5916 domain-containing protein [Candidatus Zixiibacteriota bacterium]
MRRSTLLTLLFLFCFSPLASAQTEFKPKFHPTLSVPRLTGAIKIDGRIDEPAWQSAAVADGFAEHSPGDATKPPVESKVLVGYDDQNLYLAFIAYDDPKTIRVSYRDRDNIFRDDYFGLLLDTYGDASWGYELFANPLGIQGDLRTESSGNEDESFDIVWYSKGMVTDSGYQIEVSIPFSSLRFPDKPEQTWRATFWRDRQRQTRQRSTWAALNRDNPCFMCQWGTLTGIKGIKPGSRLDLLPNIVASEQGYRQEDDSGGARFHNEKADVQLSLNAKYAITSNTAAELTINPDFSQVESDATQIDVNSPYSLYYPERRPFFQEGADLFNSRMNAVYTRSIARPKVAGKLTGHFGHTSIAYLIARDDKSPILAPSREGSYLWRGDHSISNIARIKQTFGEGSFVGALFTDRRIENSSASGTLVGSDLSIRMFRNYRFDLQALFSNTQELDDTILSSNALGRTFDRGKHTIALDGEHFWGQGISTELIRDARFWSAGIGYDERSPSFRTDNGFVTKNDYREAYIWSNLDFRPNKKYLIQWVPRIDIGRQWGFDKVRKDEWLVSHLNFTTIAQTEVWLEYLWSRELFRGKAFPGIRRGTIGASSRPSEYVGLEFEFAKGHLIARGGQLPEPVLGDGTNFYASLSLKATQRLLVEPSLDYSQLFYPDDGAEIFRAYVLRTRFTYQFTRELFLRLVVEYRDEEDYNGDMPMTYSQNAGFTIEPLLSYKINPFTIFYLGSSHDYERYDPNADFQHSSRRFFAKFQYLFRT